MSWLPGPAADDEGNIYFITGNSDYSGTTYDGTTNIQESVVKLAPDLSKVLDLFTPSNQGNLDQGDTDYGSGGGRFSFRRRRPTRHVSLHRQGKTAGCSFSTAIVWAATRPAGPTKSSLRPTSAAAGADSPTFTIE